MSDKSTKAANNALEALYTWQRFFRIAFQVILILTLVTLIALVI